ncbi:MFS transporter [Streptomyces sp. PLK6-54]|uniref:MFS transporter n=2 Tax=Actinacidiphila acidipaludis TaxID=2873382 RepID=A0ABS7QE15_9ACTN|nr:MFS transporter [Streptomyces acidipaludis]
MLWINLVDKTGSGLWVSVTALYFVVVAGLSPGRTGLLLGIGGAFGIAGPPLTGRLSDRLPLTRVLLGVQIVRGASSFLMLLAHGFWQLLPLVAAGSFGERSASVLTKIFAARVAGPDRARYQAVQRTVVNVGYTFGGLAASTALAFGTTAVYRALLLGDALSFVLVAVLVARCAEPPAATRTVVARTSTGPVAAPARRRTAGGPWKDRGYLAYAATDAVMFLYGSALSVGLPLWIITRTTAPHGLAAAVFVINTVIVVVLQVRLSRHAGTPRAAADALRPTGMWFLMCGAVTAAAVVHAGWAAALAVIGSAVALTMVEMIQSSISWELSVHLAPADAQGAYVGVHGLAQSTARCVGPFLMTSVVIATGPAGWLALGAVLAAAALLQRRLVLRRLAAPVPDLAVPPLSEVPITVSEH